MDGLMDGTMSVYTDARTEYGKQLCQVIVPAIFRLFMDLLKKAREDVGAETRKVLYQYQVLLNEIPDWNMDKVYREIGGLKTAINCEYLEELITAVFLAHTKVLMAIRVSKSDKLINLNVPKVDHFLFKVLCETGKLFWKSTYLFRDDIGNLDRQQNLRMAEQLVVEGVSNAVRAMMPVKSILRDCIAVADKHDGDDEAGDGGNESDEDVAEPAAEQAAEPAAEPAAEQAAEPAAEPATEPAAEKSAEESSADHDIVVNDREDSLSIASADDMAPALAPANVEESNTPVLHIDNDPEVSFAEFDSVFDGEHSNMHYDPKNGDTVDELIIEDGPGEPIIEFDEVDESGNPISQELEMDGYEELIG